MPRTPLPDAEQLLAALIDAMRDSLAPDTGLIGIHTGGVWIAERLHAALGLVFDPRYRDFPFAPLTAAIMPFVVLSLLAPRATGAHPLAEMLAAATLAISAVYIVLSESIANWQAVWIAILLAALAFTLFRVRAARN